MLIKYIIRYAPSIIVPAVSAFGALFFFTRLLTPEEFGKYTLLVNISNLLTVMVFYWLQIALPRLLPQAARQHNAQNLSTTGYATFLALTLVMIVISVLCLAFSTSPAIREIALFAIPLTLVRGLLAMNLLIHRNALDPLRYGLLECTQSVLGLAIGLGFVYFLHLGSGGAIIGLIIGAMLSWLGDFRTTRRSVCGRVDPLMLKEMIIFGMPLIASYGFSFILSTSDRFFIEYFHGAGAVGIYSAGYNLMERSLTMLCMITILPSYTLTVHRLEHETPDAAKEQMLHGGVALFALIFPACAGLIMVREPLAAVAIGSAFRAGAVRVMPWIGIAALLSSISTHYFHQVFNFAKKSLLLSAVLGPAAIVNIIGNILLIPPFGIMGAAYCSVISYVVVLILSIVVGRTIFPLYFPFKATMHISISTLMMIGVLWVLPVHNSVAGLSYMVIIGGGVYVAGLWYFNVLGIRSGIRSIIEKIKIFTYS